MSVLDYHLITFDLFTFDAIKNYYMFLASHVDF